MTLTDEQKEFFCERLADAAEGTQYVFKSQSDDLTTVRCCRKIVDDPVNELIQQSKTLALDFIGHHGSRMSNGVFICAQITITKNGNDIPLISLIKMDHSRVMQYIVKNTNEGRVATINEVLNSFVEDKAALQKVALVDMNDNYAWDVLARERNRTIGVADYFEGFLGVVLKGDPGKLTTKAINTVDRWARKNKKDIPSNQLPSDYKARAIQYMESHDSFDTDSFVNMVVKDEEDIERKERMMENLLEELAQKGVAGQQFQPRPDSLKKNVRRNKRVTAEGVSIIWTGEAKDVGLKVIPQDNGLYKIEIQTSRLE